ncbi:MAG: hypothetical protein MO846_03310 [Candidatus Devosia symbiotica]|nr:hypothetical protein [Candidatus Devosia symbiotica]
MDAITSHDHVFLGKNALSDGSEGLVIKTHLIGYSAAPQLSPAQLADLYELRLMLEPFVARKCAAVMPDAGIDHLAAFCAEMVTLPEQAQDTLRWGLNAAKVATAYG